MKCQTLKYDYLVEVLLHNRRNISAGFVVAIEGTLESSSFHELHRMSFEFSILLWNTNKYSNTPTLRTSNWSSCLILDTDVARNKNNISGVRKNTSWVHSSAEIEAWMFPVHSIARSTPPSVISAITLVI